MKPGQESQTAIFVCMGRAFAHGASSVPGYSDPTALALLPEDARAQVERARANESRGLAEKIRRFFLNHRSKIMVVRTVAIDDAIREARSPQLVILGAGLDGRAWRMPELRDVTVFEVDHPDSQRTKRERAQSLAHVCRDIRFVPVDFTRDNLETALAGAGHDATRPTTWVWEGVVMYLTVQDIEATLGIVERRSAPDSRLIIAYHSPSLVLAIAGRIVRRVGEPLQSALRADEMKSLLSRYGFGIVRDDHIAGIARRLPDDVARASRVVRHFRIAVSDRLTAHS